MATLWERMGDEAQIKPMLDYAYDRYSTDPLSGYTFGKGVAGNHGDPDLIKKHVLAFFSAGIGGGATYEGRDMTKAHENLNIDEVAYHGLTACFLEAFDKFKTGGRAEWNECLAVMKSLHDPVMGTTNKNPEKGSTPLWERMGGELKIKPMLDRAYDLYSTNELTEYTFGPGKAGNHGDAAKIKEHVYNFFSAGTGGNAPAYAGRDMATAHAGLKIDEVAYYQLNYCFLKAFAEHGTGGRAEWCECLDILNSLHDQVMEKTNDTV